MKCPRRNELGAMFDVPEFDGDSWRDDHSCSYCGSINPDVVMQRIEDGTVELGPTDKSYKAYLKAVDGGAPFNLGGGTGKFYFQHLSSDQKTRFIELHNEKKMKVGMPGHFYVPPFFCVPAGGNV